MIVSGCGTFDQPRSQARQDRSDACWGYGTDSAGVYLATAIFKPIVCVATDLTAGQPQYARGGFTTHSYITPAGTYRVITSPGITTIDKTSR
jgi:hypothetical protein